jgi:hypothetical protein
MREAWRVLRFHHVTVTKATKETKEMDRLLEKYPLLAKFI